MQCHKLETSYLLFHKVYGSMASKPGRIMTKGWGFPWAKSQAFLIMGHVRVRDKLETLYLNFWANLGEL